MIECAALPIDVVAIIREGLDADKRPPDGLLHASSDLIGSLRHSQLRFVGAPERPRSIVDDIRLRTGTMWHNYIHDLLGKNRVPFMAEVDVTPWMPTGWSGTADWLFYHPEYEGFVLGDAKTTKGEAIKWKDAKGMSEEHQWQLSAYWHALVEAGFPMLDTFAILYLPMNNVMREADPEPVVIEGRPLAAELVYEQMEWRYAATLEYQASLPHPFPPDVQMYLTEALSAPLDRVQKLIWKAPAKSWDVTLVPHWLADFCPYAGTGLCDCSEQGTTKIGTWTIGEKNASGKIIPGADASTLTYTPRKDSKVDFTDLAPEVAPDAREVKRRGLGG